MGGDKGPLWDFLKKKKNKKPKTNKQKKPQTNKAGTHSKAGRLTHEFPVSLECLSTSSTTQDGRREPCRRCLWEKPAQGRRAGLRTAHTFVETLCKRTGYFVWLRSPQPSAFHWWLCDDELPEPVASQQSGSHQNSVQEDQVRHKLSGTKLSYKCTTDSSKGTDPHKMDTYKRCLPGGPGTRTKVQNANVASSSLEALEGCAWTGFPSRQKGALVIA